MKKLWDLKKVFSNLELEGQGRDTIMGVTRLLLLGLFYTIQTKRDQTICTRVYGPGRDFHSLSRSVPEYLGTPTGQTGKKGKKLQFVSTEDCAKHSLKNEWTLKTIFDPFVVMAPHCFGEDAFSVFTSLAYICKFPYLQSLAPWCKIHWGSSQISNFEVNNVREGQAKKCQTWIQFYLIYWQLFSQNGH